MWAELDDEGHRKGEPLAPTLARYAGSNSYQSEVYRDLLRYAKDIIRQNRLDEPSQWGSQTEPVDLVPPHHPLDEIVTTLLYRVSHAPYRLLLQVVQSWSEKQKQDMIEVAFRQRGPYDELIKEFRSGYAFIFDILMDIGGWRDLHRHRRCQQIQQNFTTLHGYEVPPILGEAGVEKAYRQAMNAVKQDIETLRTHHQEGALYAIPFGFKVRCLFKMDFAEAEYVSQLRSGVKGHWSYRTIAWLMKQKIEEQYPYLGGLIQATPPDVEDTLTR